MRSASLLAYLALALTVTVAEPVSAQDKPRPGGELIFVVPAEPPSFDAHREETFGMLHPGAPHAQPLPQQPARHRLAQRVGGTGS
jgi:peptide/nickel transport system substrate-binding protein